MTSLKESVVNRRERIQPPQTNNYGNAHGGELVKIMDEVAAISAMRVAESPCVTARISEVNFHTPVQEGDVVGVEAFVYQTGETSLDVYTRVEREDPVKGVREEATTARFTTVAVDEDGNPVSTEDVYVETSVGEGKCGVARRDKGS
jgi:acyl-CoA hydrolase